MTNSMPGGDRPGPLGEPPVGDVLDLSVAVTRDEVPVGSPVGLSGGMRGQQIDQGTSHKRSLTCSDK
jgi:hypothetical protein